VKTVWLFSDTGILDQQARPATGGAVSGSGNRWCTASRSIGSNRRSTSDLDTSGWSMGIGDFDGDATALPLLDRRRTVTGWNRRGSGG